MALFFELVSRESIERSSHRRTPGWRSEGRKSARAGWGTRPQESSDVLRYQVFWELRLGFRSFVPESRPRFRVREVFVVGIRGRFHSVLALRARSVRTPRRRATRRRAHATATSPRRQCCGSRQARGRRCCPTGHSTASGGSASTPRPGRHRLASHSGLFAGAGEQAPLAPSNEPFPKAADRNPSARNSSKTVNVCIVRKGRSC